MGGCFVLSLGRQTSQAEAHGTSAVAEVPPGMATLVPAESLVLSSQAEGKDAEQLRSQWVRLFLADSLSRPSASFLCPSEHLPGKIRAWRSLADRN